MKYEEKLYQLNNISLHVIEAGDRHGQPLIFLHGFPEFWYGWHKQIEYFADKGYRVIVPDQRGYNLSSKPTGIKAYTTEQLAADIAALIQLLTDRKVILAGHDWGGAVSWAVAMLYPHLLHKLIILNMPHPEVMKKHLRRNPRQMLKSWYAAFFQLPWLPEKLLAARNFTLLTRSMVKTAKADSFTSDDLAKYKQAWQHPGSIQAMLNWYRAYRYSRLNTYRTISTPTQLIWGKQDQFLNHHMAYQSVERCKHGKLVVIPDATHWLHHEKPEQVNLLILSFLQQN